MDEKTLQKKNQLISMVSGFSDEYLDEELKDLNVKLVEKLARKREVPFKRGKLENWASGIVYTIAQLNFLFDQSFEPFITADDICSFFDTKKSTAANKARDIRKLLNLKLGDEEFSCEIVLDSDISRLGGNMNQAKSLTGASSHARLMEIGDMMRQIQFGSEKPDLDEVIRDILNSPGEYILRDEFIRLAWAVRETDFISSDLAEYYEYLSDDEGNLAIPVFTTEDKFSDFCDLKPRKWNFTDLALLFKNENVRDIIINPGSDNFRLTKDMVMRIVFNAI